MLLYSEQQIFGPGKMHGMITTVVVMNKVLGRENYENGRRLCLGPAEASERWFHDPTLCQDQPKEKVMRMLYVEHMPLIFFFLWNAATVFCWLDGGVWITHITNTDILCSETKIKTF